MQNPSLLFFLSVSLGETDVTIKKNTPRHFPVYICPLLSSNVKMQNLTHSSYPVVRLFLQMSDKFAEMKNDGSLDFPIGRHSWEFSHGFCGRERHKEHSLTLSQCVKNSEFTCDDGTCIVINKVTQAEREMEV